MHEATKHTPYELVFGQPPRSLLVPDVSFKGKINEEDLCESNQGHIEYKDQEKVDNHSLADQDNHAQEDQDDHTQEKQDNFSPVDQDNHSQEDQKNYSQEEQSQESLDDHSQDKKDNCNPEDHDSPSQKDQHQEYQDNYSQENWGNYSEEKKDNRSPDNQNNLSHEEQNNFSSEDQEDSSQMRRDTHSKAQGKKILRKPLATMNKHRLVREKADFHYRRNAERMKQKHSLMHRVKKFAVGESVSLRIPRIDRTATDVHRLPCVIVQVVGKTQDMYRLRCSSGVLDRCYRADDLEPFAGSYSIPENGWEKDTRISLREAARNQAPWNAFIGNRCNCRSGTCDTRKCNCKKMGIECSSHCHKGKQCKNKQVKEGSYIYNTHVSY